MQLNKLEVSKRVLRITTIFLLCIIVALVAIVFIKSHETFQKTFDAPKISLEIVDNTMIIHAKSTFKGLGKLPDAEESFVYCSTLTKTPDNCKWQNYDEFPLADGMTYYFYAKSLDTGKISAPESIHYKDIEFSDMEF